MDTMTAIQELKKFALAHYEEGGHWVYECYENEELEGTLMRAGGDVELAKEYLRTYWEMVNEQQAETRWE